MKLNHDKLANIFQEAKGRYLELETVDIDLTFNKGWFFTMRAGFEILSLFSSKRKYYINVNPRKKNILSKLSDEDIMGWFAHELAHVIDYETMSGTKLLIFSLRYVFDIKFRFSVERRINAYTYNNGFAHELFSVWKKFFVMDGVNKRYQNYIIRYYTPHWEDIQQTAEREGITEEVYRSFILEDVRNGF